MKIGIDVSQTVYEKTGVAMFLLSLLEHMIAIDTQNEYILFFSSLRGSVPARLSQLATYPHVTLKQYKIPPSLLDLLWNRLHVVPMETFIGDVDVFMSSDWTQPPSRAKKVTILYDLIVLLYPQETHNQWQFSLKSLLVAPNIVASQKRRLRWVKKECDMVFCISKATKEDAKKLLGIEENQLTVIYPGVSI